MEGAYLNHCKDLKVWLMPEQSSGILIKHMMLLQMALNLLDLLAQLLRKMIALFLRIFYGLWVNVGLYLFLTWCKKEYWIMMLRLEHFKLLQVHSL
jgi:hypothetical protein